MGELPLRGLLFVFGAFALVSAGLKGRATTRRGAGVALLTIVEGLAGMAVMATTVPGVFPVSVSATVGMATVGLVIFSTTAHLFQLRSLSRVREGSSGSRLYASITYGVGESGSKVEAEGAAADPGEGADEQGGADAAPETIEPETEFIDPITAALQTGHFDPETFMKSRSSDQDDTPEDGTPEDGTPEDDTPEDGDPSPEQGERHE
jgi:hypothetical protein